MTNWPDMKLGPIGQWPGAFTTNRQRSPFRTPGYYSKETSLGDTLELLDRELRMLSARNAELLIAIKPGDFRLDGKPRAQAVAEHPGVILSFDSQHGPLSYPCDTFTTWQANLRAIALALEALRKVDRYGVTKRGEQYRGFLALEATATPAGFASADAALAFLIDLVAAAHQDGIDDAPAVTLRRAKRIAHPDMGGDAATFQRVSLAEAALRREGRIS